MTKSFISVSFEAYDGNYGKINPFRRTIYRCVEDSGVERYYADETMQCEINDIIPGTPMQIPDHGSTDFCGQGILLNAESSENDPGSFDIAHFVVQHIPLIYCQDTLYAYGMGCYHEIGLTDLYNIIMTLCGDVIIKANNLYLLKSAAEAICVLPEIYRHSYECYPHLIPFTNGIPELNTMVFMPCDPGYFFTYGVALEYNPENVFCPVFLQYLNSVTSGNQDLQVRILEIIGYLLSDNNNAKKFFVFVGGGNSGKSILINLIESLFTEDSVYSASINDFGKNFTTGYINGKHLCLFGDMPNTSVSTDAVGVIKALTGGDTIYGDKKYKNPQKLRKNTKLLFSTNHAIRTTSDDYQFVSRCCVVPFMNSIPPQKQNCYLFNKLQWEKPAIVNLAIRAYLGLVQRCGDSAVRFSGEKKAQELYNKYISSLSGDIINNNDVIAAFIRDCCILSDSAKTHTERLFRAYVRYCEKNNTSPETYKSFVKYLGNNLMQLRTERWREGGESKRGYIGIALKGDLSL